MTKVIPLRTHRAKLSSLGVIISNSVDALLALLSYLAEFPSTPTTHFIYGPRGAVNIKRLEVSHSACFRHETYGPCCMRGTGHRQRLAIGSRSELVCVYPCMHVELGSVHKGRKGRLITRTSTLEPATLRFPGASQLP